MNFIVRPMLIILALFLVTASPAPAQAQAPVRLDIFGPGQRVLNLASADPLGHTAGMAAELDKLISDNLSFLPFIRSIPKAGIIGGTKLSGFKAPDVDFNRFQLAGADLLITTGWTNSSTVELRVYEPVTGQLVFGKAYSDVNQRNLSRVADRFCSEFMKALTGKGEFFLSTLAFAKDSGQNRNIWTVRPTGRELSQITNMSGLGMSPAWSPDGRFILFSHIDDRTHALGVWDRHTRKTQRVKFPGNTLIGPTFFPNNEVAVGLAEKGYPDIYRLDHAFKRKGVLESSGGIDVSPSIDSTGTKMAFTSSRLGNPHVFMKDLNTGSIQRISDDGTYNTEPSISPDGTLVAFSRMMAGGHRIFVHDLLTGEETQVSFGPGSDEQPAFCPDSYFLAFTSTRNGSKQIFLTTRHGGPAKQVPTGPGNASFPAWGMVPDN
ncbi:MAG: PD40 domain-containing protein [Desulfovibrionaceae bacterium]|nr:PD40 domain-containing protein [Desulfovibrionaceae bacterium]